MKACVIVNFDKSASSTTSSGCLSARARMASPNASRVALAMLVAPLRAVLGVYLRDGAVGVLFLGRRAVPGDVVFHEGDALALDRLGDDELRLALDLGRLLEGALDLRPVVAVDRAYVPVERGDLVGHRLDVHDLVHGPVDLAVVVIEDYGEIV